MTFGFNVEAAHEDISMGACNLTTRRNEDGNVLKPPRKNISCSSHKTTPFLKDRKGCKTSTTSKHMDGIARTGMNQVQQAQDTQDVQDALDALDALNAQDAVEPQEAPDTENDYEKHIEEMIEKQKRNMCKYCMWNGNCPKLHLNRCIPLYKFDGPYVKQKEIKLPRSAQCEHEKWRQHTQRFINKRELMRLLKFYKKLFTVQNRHMAEEYLEIYKPFWSCDERVDQMKALEDTYQQVATWWELHKQKQQQHEVQPTDSDASTDDMDIEDFHSSSSDEEPEWDEDERLLFNQAQHSQDNVQQKSNIVISPSQSDNNHDRLEICNEQVISQVPTNPQLHESTRTGEMKNKASPCEPIITTKFTNFCLNDHSYYQNQPHNFDCLGIQTPSESEDEEIDVVTCRAVAQRTAPSRVLQRPNQRTQQLTARASGNVEPPVRRPRGRPPSNPDRKRKAHVLSDEAQQQQPAKRKRKQVKAPKSRNSSDDEEDRRNLHNDMERRRRVDLRNHFEGLRKLIPSILDKERSPKVMILNEATKHCINLTDQWQYLSRKRNGLKGKSKMQTSRLRYLLAIIARSSRLTNAT